MNKRNIKKMNHKISKIWDSNVITRAQDLENGIDTNYLNTIKPYILGEIKLLTSNSDYILDIGCGCGFLTNAIFNINRRNIVGIDISEQSIFYSQKKYPYINFIVQDIYSFSTKIRFDCCLSIMTLNNIPDLKLFLKKTYQLLTPTGFQLVMIPHPFFWSQKHIDYNFIYDKDKKYEITFRKNGSLNYNSKILYFHRPLETYINNFIDCGFNILKIKEIYTNNSTDFPPDIIAFILTKK